jgi:hypothetical protein
MQFSLLNRGEGPGRSLQIGPRPPWTGGQDHFRRPTSAHLLPSGYTNTILFPRFLAYRTVAQVPDRSNSFMPLGVATSTSAASTIVVPDQILTLGRDLRSPGTSGPRAGGCGPGYRGPGVVLGIGANGIAMMAGLRGHEAGQHGPHCSQLARSHAALGCPQKPTITGCLTFQPGLHDALQRP